MNVLLEIKFLRYFTLYLFLYLILNRFYLNLLISINNIKVLLIIFI